MSKLHCANQEEQQQDVHKSVKSVQAMNNAENSSMETLTRMQQNMVTTVDLLGIPIIALVIDGQERLCLAQISNTLLKQYSYNEVHNRRVALGINCVQCTPVQLEILRRTGAMPVSSRRCGMITKKEAERLCKSFLTECPPPQLPDGFFFSVAHNCAWGCKGSFIPSRYNSSRAKCIQCAHCRLFFSPNKFIFHSHRFSESTYTQPDAANFNNWRRHLHLTMGGKEKIVDRRPYTPRDQAGVASEEMVNLWEDVKAMFNGGTRRRFTSAEIMTHPTGMTTARHDSIPASNHLIRNFCCFKTDLSANQDVIKPESQNQPRQGAARSFIESALQTRTTLDHPCSSSSKNSAINSSTTISMQYNWLLDRYFNNNLNNYADSMQTANFVNSNVANGHFLTGSPFWTSNPFLSQPILAQQMHVISAHLSKNDQSKLTPDAISQQSVIINPSNHNLIDNQDHNFISSNRYDIRSLLMTKGSNSDCNAQGKANSSNLYHTGQDHLNRENLIEQLRQTENSIPEQGPEREDL